MNQNSAQIGQTSPLQRSILVIEKLKSKLNKLESAQREPIAIIGMGCRFPGKANDPEKFWQLLANGEDGVIEIPRDRWDVDNYYEQNPNSPGKMSTKFGGFLGEIDKFDPLFFRISPKEALSIDPQHRLLLEVTWEALENAGNIPERLPGSITGVFVGITLNDYGKIVKQAKASENLESYGVTGFPLNAAAGRISYTFGFTGPCMSIDTACSSSLVAIHQACQSLRAKECDMALAGGVNLILLPDSMIATSKAKMLSVDGRCKTFDEAADGMGRGEGCGMLVLKRLSDAQAQGDNILALIRGSAINQDGPSSGLTVPNGSSQQKVMHQALKMAKVEPADVSYLEAHGTGTPLGDPIELRSIAKVYGKAHSQEQPLVIGSVKTNLSHIETAAGVAAVIKVVLQLQHKQIVPHLHLKEPTSHFNWENYSVTIPNRLIPWQVNQQNRLAGINSFGASGTNVHLILEEAPAKVRTHSSINTKERPVHLLTLSAKNPKALSELVSRYHNHLETHPELAIADICYTANTGRLHFEYRLAIVASNQEELAEKLLQFNLGKEVIGLLSGQIPSNTSLPKIAFLFSGQGSQYINMARQLYETQTVFREALNQCNDILSCELERPLLEILYPETTQESSSSLLDQTAYAQPALFALEYALTQLWKSWGIKPNLVMGHSLGEYVAACVAGVFSLEDGLKLIAHRGRLMQELSSGGGMVAVMTSFEKVNQLIDPYIEEVAIAAINGPESVVISGTAEAMGKIRDSLEAEGIKTKQLQVSHAFHSPLMEPMLAEFEAVANQITYHQPRIPLLSNVTGSRADESIATASYWVNHVRQPVKFVQSMETLHQEGYEVFLEIGPKPILLGMGRQCLPEGIGVWLPSLRDGQEDCPQMLQSLGELYVRGVKVDWSGFDRNYYRSKVVLPSYPFQRQRYWIETSEKESQNATHSSSENKTRTIVDWLNEGNTQDIAQQLEKLGQFSPEQANLLPEMLEILVKQHRCQLTAATVKDWFYQLQWKPLLDTEPKTSIQPGHWLIFADATGVGEILAQQLSQQGCECSLVYRGDRYQKLGSGSYQLNPTELQEFKRLIQAIGENSKFPLQKVIHLWSLDAPTPKDLTITSLEQAQRWGCGTALHLVKALNKTKNVPQLWLVTRGAQSVQSKTEEVSVAASPLWGMGRVVSLEHPQLWGGMVDLDPQTPESETETLLQLLADKNQREDHLALRGERTYIARLVKQSPTASQTLSLNSDATYLITGGLGALGLHTASWMVEKGARHLVLISRTQPSEHKIAAISNLQQQGAEVVVVQANVCNFEELSKIFEQIDSHLTPLKGIVHAAGVGGIQAMQQIELTQLEEVMAAKVKGGWILHQLTQDKELDFFVSFSSIAAVWGSAGQAHYAASNHFLDGLTHYRRAKGLPSFSINWGPWSGGGLAGEQDLKELSKRGVEPLSPEQGISALEQLWTSGNLQTTVANVNWSLFKQLYEIGRRKLLLEEIEVELLETELTKTKQYELLERLESVPENERYNLLRTHIQSEVAKVLGLNDSQLAGFEQGFFDLGMDSLMAVELRDRIIQLLGVTLPSTLAFDFPTIEQLTKHISSQVLHLSPENDAHQAEPQKVKAVDHEPIAIIGMGCSFPGGATTPEKFWELLQEGISAREEIPPERWDINTYYDPDREAPGKMITRYGHFIKSVDQFDPGFFGISPREATAIDPQHRLLLEVSWQALERAGQKVERLSAAPVGVFVGNDGHDYEQLMQEHLQQEPNSPLATYTGTGNSISSAAGRLAYTFGFTGPTVTLDTACSSSLVAIHQACNSLRLGECQMAIAGGVKLHLTPGGYIFTSRAGMISPDGLCKTFDISADGYARGEGCGMVVLKRLSQAQEDGDPILALIRGSAVNQDGPSSGLTVPNGQSQQKLLKQALNQARVKPAEISYLEAHGTGTSLGDPIEVNAAAAVLGQSRPPEQPLWIGTVKTNIGHLEAAAGVSALIKVVLSMQHQQLPAHLHLQELNPKIDWQPWLRIPQALTPWVAPKGRLAGVSSFGFTGTNAHVVLEEAPAAMASPTGEYERPVHLLQLSAKNDLALAELAQRYGDHLDANPEQDLGDICFTANSGRSAHSHRLAVVASNREELQNKLHEFSTGSREIGVVSGQVSSNQSAKVAMLFTGQGSQYVGMGRKLYQSQPTFKQVMEQCAEILKDYLDKPLLEILYGTEVEENVLAQTSYTQPALFAIEYALAQLWESWGIKPDVVMGHSVGEYVAATIAGVFSLEDGLKLIAHRGHLMQQLPHGGEMVAEMASFEKVNQLIAPYTEKVAIAAINGPQSVVISGAAEAIRTVQDSLEAEGIKSKQLQVSHAFHSPLMEPMMGSFEAVANQITYHQPQIPLVSNVTGTRADESIATASYWVNHVRQPVQFARSMETLYQEGYQIFLEIGPKPILLGMGRQCLPADVGVWLPSLRPTTKQAPEFIGSNNPKSIPPCPPFEGGRNPKSDDWQQMLHSLGELYVQGINVDWSGFDRDYSRSKVVLPTYPFQRQRYWIETSENGSQKAAYSSSESKTTTIADWLNDGNTQQLAQQLEKVGQFSPEQVYLLPEMLEILVKQHHCQLTAATVKDWLYQVQWKPFSSQVKTTLETTQNSQPSHWLILADATGVGQALAAHLQQQGHQCTLVHAGDAYQIRETGIYGLNPSHLEDFQLLFQELLKTSQLPLKGIIHLWSLDAVTSQQLTISALEQSQRWGCGSVLHLLQALIKQNLSDSPRLWLITRGAQSLASQTNLVAVAQTPIWGLGKVVALEHPRLWGGMVDLDPSAPEGEVEMLLRQIQDNQGEDHFAFREGQPHVPCLVKKLLTGAEAFVFDYHSTYLITGGLGALGLQVAQWMVEQGVKHLVLTGRREASDTAQKVIRQLEQQGTKVLLLQADVSKPEDVAQMLEVIKSSLPPLRGIIHAAGVLDDGVLQQMSWESLRRVMAPKVEGAWNLHTLTQNSPLDFFICFSSVASLLGSSGQGNYAAANAFMDGLVYYRRAIGLPGLSINWGPWSTAGMAANLDSRYQSRMVAMGITPLASEQGLLVLGQLLEQSLPQVGVLPVEWSVFQEQFSVGNQMPLLSELVTESESTKTKQHELLERLESVPEGEGYDLLRTHIQTEVAKVLGLDSSELLAPDVGFVDMGMDSLMAVELKNRLQNHLGTSLAATLAIEYPTIQKLSKYLAEQVMGWRLPEKSEMNLPKIEEEQANALSEIEQLGEDDIEASIAKKLAKLETLIGGDLK